MLTFVFISNLHYIIIPIEGWYTALEYYTLFRRNRLHRKDESYGVQKIGIQESGMEILLKASG